MSLHLLLVAGAIERSLGVQRVHPDPMCDPLAAERRIGAYPSATSREVESMLDVMGRRLQPGA